MASFERRSLAIAPKKGSTKNYCPLLGLCYKGPALPPSCFSQAATSKAAGTTALDAVGVIPGAGNILHGVQFVAAIVAAGISTFGSARDASLSATGAGLDYIHSFHRRTWRITINPRWPASVLRFGLSCVARAPHPSLVATATFDHGCRFQTTETSGESYLFVGCGHRGHESSKGGLKSDPSQSHFWLRQCSSSNDQGTYPILWRWTPGSRVSRTPWPTKQITSN